MTITVNVCGLDRIVEAVNNLAQAMGASGVSASLCPNSETGTSAQQASPASFTNPMPGTQGMISGGVPTSPVPQQIHTSGPLLSTGPQTMPSTPIGQVPTTTTAPGYTQDQIAVAMTCLVDQGKQPQVMQVLSQFGAASLMQVPKEQYGALATQLRMLGANL